MEYPAVIQRADDGTYSAYLPNLPGCVACGDTVEEARQLIREAAKLHIESLRKNGEPVPLHIGDDGHRS
jgi:predicted RNase H-like HicB family nuclease